MLALCSMLLHTYYAHFSAGIIGAPLLLREEGLCQGLSFYISGGSFRQHLFHLDVNCLHLPNTRCSIWFKIIVRQNFLYFYSKISFWTFKTQNQYLLWQNFRETTVKSNLYLIYTNNRNEKQPKVLNSTRSPNGWMLLELTPLIQRMKKIPT